MFKRHTSDRESRNANTNKIESPARKEQGYSAPRVIEVGSAVDLVQSYSWGAYADGYTGYKWNR